MKIKIEESPYGDRGAEYTGMLGMIKHFRLQLISFRSQAKTPEERQYLEDDIRGYEMILESKSEKNAQAFMNAKRGRLFEENGYQELFKNNIEVVEYLKSNGLWEEIFK